MAWILFWHLCLFLSFFVPGAVWTRYPSLEESLYSLAEVEMHAWAFWAVGVGFLFMVCGGFFLLALGRWQLESLCMYRQLTIRRAVPRSIQTSRSRSMVVGIQYMYLVVRARTFKSHGPDVEANCRKFLCTKSSS